MNSKEHNMLQSFPTPPSLPSKTKTSPVRKDSQRASTQLPICPSVSIFMPV